MTLMRGLADDLPLMSWLKEHIWPVEMREVSSAFVHDGTLLACAEMLRGGVTTFNDMYFFPEAAAQAALTAGMRAALGMIVVDFPSPYAADPLDYLAKGMALRDAMRDQPLLSFCFAPHAPYSVADKALAQVATYANELDVPVHIHVHETLDEIAQATAQSGRRPLSRLESLGLLTPNLIAVHAAHLNPSEIEALARNGCHVVHCPSSNMKLASGIAPICELLAAGVNVAPRSLPGDAAGRAARQGRHEGSHRIAGIPGAAHGNPWRRPRAIAGSGDRLTDCRQIGRHHRRGFRESGTLPLLRPHLPSRLRGRTP
jgi:5-methylthioadenosine/S-adenosylhomocysteine deaminase